MASGTNRTSDKHPQGGICYYLLPDFRVPLVEPRGRKTLRLCTRFSLLPLTVIALLAILFIALKANRPFSAKTKILLGSSLAMGLFGSIILCRHHFAYKAYEDKEYADVRERKPLFET